MACARSLLPWKRETQTRAGKVDLERWTADRAAAPLDWSRRAFDAALVPLGDGRTAWYLNLHHGVTDGVSHTLVVRHVGAAYAALERGEVPALRLAPFADVVAARERPGAEPPALPPRPEPLRWSVARHSGGRRRWSITRSRSTRSGCALRSPPNRSPALTPSVGMLAALVTATAVAANRLAGASELCVGVVLHNRIGRREKATIGMLMEVCPVIVHVDGDDALAEVHARAREAITQALRDGTDTGTRGAQNSTTCSSTSRPTRFAGFGGRPTAIRPSRS